MERLETHLAERRDMTSRYHWVSFADWQAMSTADRDKTEKWAKTNGLEVAIDLRDDHNKPKPEDDEETEE